MLPILDSVTALSAISAVSTAFAFISAVSTESVANANSPVVNVKSLVTSTDILLAVISIPLPPVTASPATDENVLASMFPVPSNPITLFALDVDDSVIL